MIWFLRKFFGRKYFIFYTDKLKDGEILIIGHKFYIGRKER